MNAGTTLNGAKMLAASDGHGNPDSKPLLERRMHTWEKRYESACENLRHLNVSPSHEEIGRLLDVPPGTVSSGLFFCQKNLERHGIRLTRSPKAPLKKHPGSGTADDSPDSPAENGPEASSEHELGKLIGIYTAVEHPS